MSFKLRPGLDAFFFAFVILPIQSSTAADGDDHSYLPPWMLDQPGAVTAVDPHQMPPGEKLQTTKADLRAEKADAPITADLTAKATQVKIKAMGFIDNLFRSPIRFATGE